MTETQPEQPTSDEPDALATEGEAGPTMPTAMPDDQPAEHETDPHYVPDTF